MSKIAGRLAILFSLLGLLASGVAAYTHYRLLTDLSYVSFCDVSATISCSDVYSSQYGSMGGVSVAVFGVIWFAFATLLSVAGVGARSSVRESIPGYLFAGSTLALSVVLYLGYTSFFVLHRVCVLCLLTYVAAIGLFLISGAGGKIPMLSLPRRASNDLRVLSGSPLAIALTALFVVGAGSALAFFPRDTADSAAMAGASAALEDGQPVQGPDPEFEKWYLAQPRVALEVPAEGAQVLVVKFNDFQCPACGQSYQDYKSVLSKYEDARPGALRVVLKDFPLESECNANVTGDLHTGSCEAAVAMRLVNPEHADALEEWLYSNQSAMTPQSVKEAARNIGQIEDFDARYGVTLEAVKADIEYGRQLGIRSTPTFFINGTKVEGSLPAQYFDQAIAYELERATSQ
jgi:uncharacterized membrane protein/protein-disulfide isomerase